MLRVDNTKTAVAQGAGPWGELNAAYQRYATTLRFHIDPCLPRSPEHKGKVERHVRTQRAIFDPRDRYWTDAEAVQRSIRRRSADAVRRQAQA